ncbi:MAG: hypothetical protein P4L92_13065 [Rudaea sp.]|nr:hypothetical protein [Rudaea sp.]
MLRKTARSQASIRKSHHDMFSACISIRTARHLMLGAAVSVAASCATTSPDADNALTRLHLFGDGNSAHFTFYFSCAGEVAAETQMCWIPAKYFQLWADERHVAIRQLNGTFDDERGVPADQLGRSDTGFDYRIVARFRPIAVPSTYDLVDGSGGYKPPKAGYNVDLYVYSGADGKLVLHTDYHRKSDAAYKADAVPYVKQGIHAVLAALDPVYAQANPVER